MNPLQLRETTMAPDTRRLVMLTEDGDDTDERMDMLLGEARLTAGPGWKPTAIWQTLRFDIPNKL